MRFLAFFDTVELYGRTKTLALPRGRHTKRRDLITEAMFQNTFQVYPHDSGTNGCFQIGFGPAVYCCSSTSLSFPHTISNISASSLPKHEQSFGEESSVS